MLSSSILVGRRAVPAALCLPALAASLLIPAAWPPSASAASAAGCAVFNLSAVRLGDGAGNFGPALRVNLPISTGGPYVGT